MIFGFAARSRKRPKCKRSTDTLLVARNIRIRRSRNKRDKLPDEKVRERMRTSFKQRLEIARRAVSKGSIAATRDYLDMLDMQGK